MLRRIAILAVVLGGPGAASTPAEAQMPRCDDGNSLVITDLGFESPRRSTVLDPLSGRSFLGFPEEPRIRGVREDGPAGGRLRDGDVLIAVDGVLVTTAEGVRRLSGIRAGERVRLSVRRGEGTEAITVVAAARCVPLPAPPPRPPVPPLPAAPPPPPPPPLPPLPPPDELMPEGWFGFAIGCEDCGDDDETGAFRFRAPPVITSVVPGSPAARAGLHAGDRLIQLDGLPLTAPAGWPRFYAIQPGEQVRWTVIRDGKLLEATMRAERAPARR